MLLAALALSLEAGCATNGKYKIRVVSENKQPRPGSLVLATEGSILPLQGVFYIAWGSVRAVFTGEDASSWMRRVKHFPPVLAGVTDADGTVEIRGFSPNVFISAINPDLDCVWSSFVKGGYWQMVEYELTPKYMRKADDKYIAQILRDLERSLERKENQRPEIFEFKNRLEKFIEEQAQEEQAQADK